MTTCDVLVVGAGPAGLATSRELSRAGVQHLVLERGDQVGHTWANLYDSLVLHTARPLSSLPGLSFPAATPIFPTRRDLLAYLHRYAETFRVPVQTGVDVTSLRRGNAGWIAATATGADVHARAVVVATGIVANPHVPAIPQRARFGGRVLHSVDYRRPEGYEGRRVLLLGAGNSAGEISVELARAGARVTLGVRTGASVVPRTLLGVPIHYLALVVASLPRAAQRGVAAAMERVAALVRGPALLPSRPPGGCAPVPMIGFHLADALRAGTIRLKGDLAEFTERGVRFLDGSEEPFDEVILATGYKAALGMMGDAIGLDDCGFARRRDRVVSLDQPDLCFVGHNYDLRGGLFNIGRDARLAARRLTRRDRRQTSTGTPPRRHER